MEFKGTKEKWGILEYTSDLEVGTEIGDLVCSIPIKNEEYQANAKLISKAPELLERLKELYGAVSIYSDYTNMPEYIKIELQKSYQLIKEATEL